MRIALALVCKFCGKTNRLIMVIDGKNSARWTCKHCGETNGN